MSIQRSVLLAAVSRPASARWTSPAPRSRSLVLSPLLALIAIAIRLDSGGAVIFRQQRCGRGGRFFTLYKFRSMRTDSTVLVRDDGAIVKRADDDRVTARRTLPPPLLARRGAAAVQRAAAAT